MSRRVTATNTNEGINKLIQEYKTVFRSDIIRGLRTLRVTINDRVDNPYNALIVLYIDDQEYEVKVGEGERRYNFNIPDHESESSITAANSTLKVKISCSPGRTQTEKPGSIFRTVAACSAGSVGGTLVYAALATNPATLPLALAAASGAAVNTMLLGQSGSEIHTNESGKKSIEIEGTPESIRDLLRNREVAQILGIDNK